MITQMSSSPARCLHDCRSLSAVRVQSPRQNPGYSQQQRLPVCIIHLPPPHPYRKDPTNRPSGLRLLLASVPNMTSPFLIYRAPFNSAQTAPLSRLSPYSPRSNPDASLANPSPVSNTATCPPSPRWPSRSLLPFYPLVISTRSFFLTVLPSGLSGSPNARCPSYQLTHPWLTQPRLPHGPNR